MQATRSECVSGRAPRVEHPGRLDLDQGLVVRWWTRIGDIDRLDRPTGRADPGCAHLCGSTARFELTARFDLLTSTFG